MVGDRSKAGTGFIKSPLGLVRGQVCSRLGFEKQASFKVRGLEGTLVGKG